jgi:spermidine synthase
MAVELLGARMLSPVYGGSLVVWAAMISVTMLSLAVGYFAGGWLADRFPRPTLVWGTLILSGLLVAVCPCLRFVLGACHRALGIRGGALAASAVLFFLPLAMMGTVSPAVIRLLSAGRGVGVTAGGVYALSTVGSVAGTLLTGLLMIPCLGTRTGFLVAAAGLAAVGAIGQVFSMGARGAPTLLFSALPALVLLLPGGAAGSYVAPDGQEVRVVDVRESAHGHIVVLDKGDYRLLVVGGIIQTGVPRRLELLQKTDCLKIGYYQELLPYTLGPGERAEGKRALLIGLAGGMTAAMLRLYGMKLDAVDIDPEVISVAREHFSFTGPAVAADGRRFLEDCTEKYDFCVIDTYSGDAFPFHLASVEAFRAARGALKPGGVLAVNYIGAPGGRAFACTWRTIREVFPHVRALRGEPGDDVQTITVFASDRKIEFNRGWLDHTLNFGGVDPISESIARLALEPDASKAFVLTDDYNPIDFLRAEEALRWRRRTVQNIGEGASLR